MNPGEPRTFSHPAKTETQIRQEERMAAAIIVLTEGHGYRDGYNDPRPAAAVRILRGEDPRIR